MCLRWDFAAVAAAKGKGESDPPDKGLKDWPTLWTLKLADCRESIRASREIGQYRISVAEVIYFILTGPLLKPSDFFLPPILEKVN